MNTNETNHLDHSNKRGTARRKKAVSRIFAHLLRHRPGGCSAPSKVSQKFLRACSCCFTWERVVVQRLLDPGQHQRRDIRFFHFARGHRRPHVAIKIYRAPPPQRFRIKLTEAFHQPQTLVGNKTTVGCRGNAVQLAFEPSATARTSRKPEAELRWRGAECDRPSSRAFLSPMVLPTRRKIAYVIRKNAKTLFKTTPIVPPSSLAKAIENQIWFFPWDIMVRRV
jgi:hypothetical protein